MKTCIFKFMKRQFSTDQNYSFFFIDRLELAQDIMQTFDMGGRKFQEEYKDVFRLPLTGDIFITVVEKSDGK